MTTWTAREAILWAASFLHKGLTETSHTFAAAPKEEQDRMVQGEAMTLLEYATGWSRTRILVSFSDAVPDTALDSLRTMTARRASGEPLQYVVGEAWFYGRPFAVEPGCLIPRPETELLVEQAVGWIQKHRPNAHAADLGTGSGCIAVTIALECPRAAVTALDLSEAALQIAKRNAAQHEAKVDFVHTDGVQWLRDDAGTGRLPLNVLVSNPPYIPSDDVDVLDTEVRTWEPRLALDGGDDGLDIYRALCAVGSRMFADGPAALFLEVGAGQADAVRDLFAVAHAGEWPGWTFDVRQDLRGIGRIVWGERR